MNYRLTFYKYEIKPFWLRTAKLHQKQSPLQHNGDCFFCLPIYNTPILCNTKKRSLIDL